MEKFYLQNQSKEIVYVRVFTKFIAMAVQLTEEPIIIALLTPTAFQHKSILNNLLYRLFEHK